MIFGRPKTKSPKDWKAPDGVQPTFMLPTNQSPEWATGNQRHTFSHPFGVLFIHTLCAGCTPACVTSSPAGTCCPRGYRWTERPTHSQPRASPWAIRLSTFQAVNNRNHGDPVSLKPYAILNYGKK